MENDQLLVSCELNVQFTAVTFLHGGFKRLQGILGNSALVVVISPVCKIPAHKGRLLLFRRSSRKNEEEIDRCCDTVQFKSDQ